MEPMTVVLILIVVCVTQTLVRNTYSANDVKFREEQYLVSNIDDLKPNTDLALFIISFAQAALNAMKQRMTLWSEQKLVSVQENLSLQHKLRALTEQNADNPDNPESTETLMEVESLNRLEAEAAELSERSDNAKRAQLLQTQRAQDLSEVEAEVDAYSCCVAKSVPQKSTPYENSKLHFRLSVYKDGVDGRGEGRGGGV